MDSLNTILKLSAGVGLFLFAMYLVEESLKNLSGRSFKLFLQRITKNNLGAVAGGTIVTGILQSSSMVSLMVLAFVGAGVFTMKNAMAVILGANLGTTIASWLVATLGFKTDIDYMNRNIKSNFKQADKLDSRFIIIIGEEEMKSKVQRKTTLLCILRSYKELFNFFHENTKCLVPEEFKSWLE